MALYSLLNRRTKKSADEGVTGLGQDEGWTGLGQEEGVIGLRQYKVWTGLGQDKGVTVPGQDEGWAGLGQDKIGRVLQLLLLLQKRLSKLLMFLKLQLQIMLPGIAGMLLNTNLVQSLHVH